MNSTRLVFLFGVAATLFLQAFPEVARGAQADRIPDFTRGDVVPAGATHDWNLGPTGARGWIYSNRMETSEARQILITEVESGSPADGILRPGDVILGVSGRLFAFDPRMELGRAIGEAEAVDGRLVLLRWREKSTEEITIQLAVFGRYSATAPFDCPKSKLLLERGCRAIAASLLADPRKGNRIVRALNALALLSSGDPEYLPVVRQQVAEAAKYSDPERRDLHSWNYGPINILLAEYTLATGDRTFLPDLRRISMEIARGQSGVGSWGHRFVSGGGPRLDGYGMMNSPGIPLAISLILAREAGVSEPELDPAIAKSVRLLRFYSGKGSVPYGDHHPWIETHDDNGKNGMAAVMFNLMGDAEATGFFSRMSVASHGAERDTGHTGNYFNILWAMPGVAHSGPQATGAWIGEFGWYLDLARRWDGTFAHQGPPSLKPDSYAGWDATGPFMLAYAQPYRKIFLTGKKPSVADPVDASTARSLIEDGRDWGPRLKLAAWEKRSDGELLQGLQSWSPVVRERSALVLADRKTSLVPQLMELLESDSLFARLGACQALARQGRRAAPAVPLLRETLLADDLWLKVKAADALASIGDAAMVAVPDLLAMLAEGPAEDDPRGMLQRFLCFAVFDRREGLLRRSLDGVDREALYRAVRAGLKNEDGRARSTLGTILVELPLEMVSPLLPAVHQAVVEPAPSGEMFADGIRLSGLEVFARHQIAEGMPLCLETIEMERWGRANRIEGCLKSLQVYGGAARPVLPRLREIESQLEALSDAKANQRQIELVRETIRRIEADTDPPTLRTLDSLR